ncbi:hypothetical protein BLNAU_6103 [Blattamonas nauphoetae]|uniref:Uncharacterized protein n=1 Tax=Blattamonas nauphoetae TaxID=2049346 RepID=A0ABQ9Y5A1_9EUKA|nr:hypothetical protein BLNAU_6103 [Blattamonas nauphoetae]
MEEETRALTTSNENALQDSFLSYDMNSELSSENKSTVFCSLVALVTQEYPFTNALQFRATEFLKLLEPDWTDEGLTDKHFTDLVPLSNGSPSGFIQGILTLVACPHSSIVAAALTTFRRIVEFSPDAVRLRFVEADLVSNLLASVQPHPQPISGSAKNIDLTIRIIVSSLYLSYSSCLRQLGITAAVDQYNHREMIFQKAVIPSTQYVTYLISNRFHIHEDLIRCFMNLLDALIPIGPSHRPTLEFVLASPIAMAFSSCLSVVESRQSIWKTLANIDDLLRELKTQDKKVIKSGQRMIQSLISEGIEDTLEQKLKHIKDGVYNIRIGVDCCSISRFLGSNVVMM